MDKKALEVNGNQKGCVRLLNLFDLLRYLNILVLKFLYRVLKQHKIGTLLRNCISQFIFLQLLKKY